jgi:hypothetical protein
MRSRLATVAAVAIVAAAASVVTAGTVPAPPFPAVGAPSMEDQRSTAQAASSITLPPYVATFSILGYDPTTGMIGGAVQSRVFSVGNGVLWGEANVGMVATQAIVDVSYGPQALELLRRGMAPADIIETILDSDPDPGYRGRPWPKAGRQFAVMNAAG